MLRNITGLRVNEVDVRYNCKSHGHMGGEAVLGIRSLSKCLETSTRRTNVQSSKTLSNAISRGFAYFNWRL